MLCVLRMFPLSDLLRKAAWLPPDPGAGDNEKELPCGSSFPFEVNILYGNIHQFLSALPRLNAFQGLPSQTSERV